MFFYCYALFLAAVLQILPVIGLSPSPTALKPINIHDFEVATGVHRRAAENFSHLDLSTQAQLIYGRPGDDGQLLLVDMTLYAPDGLQMVMMERFEPLTSTVDCNDDDGTMSLTFKSQEAFKHALDTWSFINQAQEKQFLLIANHDGCGPQDERQPYLITQIREDQDKLTTFLTAQKAPWSDIAGTYDLDFGRAIRSQRASRRRGLFSGITHIASDTGDSILHGRADLIKSITFPVNVGTPGVATDIVSTSSFSLSCIDCYVAGSFQVTGHLSVKSFKLQDFTLSGSPQGLAAKLELETKITASDSPTPLQSTKELFSAPIPGAGISVPGIFSLGAVVSYDIGVSTTFAGSASMTFGLSASLPDTAALVADVQNPSASSATGFDGGHLEHNFNLTALSAGVTVAAFSQAKLSFGIDITTVGHLDVALALKLPAVEANVTGAYNESGLCSAGPGASKTGARVTTDVVVEVDLNLDAKLGSDTQPSKSIQLFKAPHPLSSDCFPIDIPGLGSKPSRSTTVQSVPTTAASPSGLQSASSVAIGSISLLPIPTSGGTGGYKNATATTVPYRWNSTQSH